MYTFLSTAFFLVSSSAYLFLPTLTDMRNAVAFITLDGPPRRVRNGGGGQPITTLETDYVPLPSRGVAGVVHGRASACIELPSVIITT